MFRIRFFKYVIQKQFRNSVILLQNDIKLNKFRCQCISSINLTSKLTQHKLGSINEEIVDNLENKTLTDKEYLIRLKNDPDKFGPPQEKETIDEGDIAEEKFFTEQPSPAQKLRTKQYADMIKKLIRERKIKEAIDVVEVRMLKEDRVQPENYLFNLLLGACGRVGYTKKAFKLYNDMKRRGLKVTGGTYTALFNACANSPWQEDGLERATHLRNIMIEKGDEPNATNYNVMIKAFGRCGDLPTAFTLVDEMCSKGFTIKDDTINFLLQACIADKEAGFRHALLVWRRLISKNISPSTYTYNLMLRCIRDCGLGDIEVTQDVINKIISDNNELLQETIENSDKKLLSYRNKSFDNENIDKREEVKFTIENSAESKDPCVSSENIEIESISLTPQENILHLSTSKGLEVIDLSSNIDNCEDINLTTENFAESKDPCVSNENVDIKSISLTPQENILHPSTSKGLEVKDLRPNIDKCEDINLTTENSAESRDPSVSSENVEIESISLTPQENILHPSTSKGLEVKDLRPNLMARVPHLGSLISLSEITKPQERLLLVGGSSGFLENMKENQCMPDIKTFTQLLHNIPSTLASEKDLMSAMKKFNVNPDIDFYNMLIKKRSMRYDFENARAVLKSMEQQKFMPNLITYGVLALSCKYKEEALGLLNEMKSKNYSLNIQILGAMLHQACYHVNFGYVLELMETCLIENVQPSKKFMTTLDEFMKKCKRSLYSKELTKSQEKAFRILKARYKTWVQEIKIDETEDAHPWRQYREINEQDTSKYKWKDGARFKARHISSFRVQTSTKRRM